MTQDKQILDCETKLLEAMKTGNIQVLDELIHDDLVFNIPTGQTITKEMDIENYKSGILKISDLTVIDQMIKSTDDISIVTVIIHLKGKYGEQIIDGKFRYLRIWKLFDNSWKIIAGSGFQI